MSKPPATFYDTADGYKLSTEGQTYGSFVEYRTTLVSPDGTTLLVSEWGGYRSGYNKAMDAMRQHRAIAAMKGCNREHNNLLGA